MSVYGTGAVQAAMLRVLSQKIENNSAKSIFADMLSSQLKDALAGAGAFGTADSASVYPAGADASMLLLSFLGGDSNLLMQGLGKGMSRQTGPAAGAYGSYSAGMPVTPERASRPATPAVISGADNRSPRLYNSVIAQFAVETNPRYAVNKKGTGDTYCNIFVWDVTSAMGAEIPHYINPQTGAPMTYPDVEGARFQSANRIYNWLHEFGSQYGWYQVSAEEAQALANRGQPVVASLKRNGASGHVQMVCPSADGSYDPERGVTVAQAGSTLTSYKPITSILGKASLSKVAYFAHA